MARTKARAASVPSVGARPRAAAAPSSRIATEARIRRDVSRASGRIGAAGLNPVNVGGAMLGVAGMTYGAVMQSKESGGSTADQIAAGAKAGGRALGTSVGAQLGIVAAERKLLTMAPSLAAHGAKALVAGAKFALPGLGLVMAGVGAYRGWQASRSVAGAAVGALTGGYVPPSMRSTDVAAASAPVPIWSSSPSPLTTAVTAPVPKGAGAPVSGAFLDEAAARKASGASPVALARGQRVAAAPPQQHQVMPTKMVNGRSVANPWFTARDRMKAFGHAAA